MTKLLVLVLVIVLALAWLMRRGGASRKAPEADPAPRPGTREPPAPAAMLACSHCGVHLPQADAAFDAVGRPYCSAEHRVAGPR